MKNLNEKNKLLAFALLLVFYGSLLAFQIELPVADDMGRHLKNGELMLSGHFEVLYKNVYSYTMPNQPFINHHWLPGVIFFVIQNLFGWNGLVIFKILILLTAFSFLFFACTKKTNFWPVAFFSIPAIFLMAERSTLRPENFSYLFISLYFYVLADWEQWQKNRKILWLIPIQILWVNMHIFFIFGPGLIGLTLLEKIITSARKREAIFSKPEIRQTSFLLVLLMLACLINPSGLAGALYPLHIFQDYGMDVAENQPFNSLYNFYSFSVNNIPMNLFYPALVVLVGSFIVNYKNFSLFHFILFAGTTVGTLKVIRLLGPFGLMALPIVTYNFNTFFLKARDIMAGIVVNPPLIRNYIKGIFHACLLIAIIFQFNSKPPSLGLSARSNDAGDFFKRKGLRGPIFNDYDIGSYLDYHLYPREKVFLDNRPEAFTASFFREINNPIFTDERKWKSADARYNFNCIFLHLYDAMPGGWNFIKVRFHDPQWALVYADCYAVIFLKNNTVNAPLINRYKIDKDNVEARVAYLLQSSEYIEKVAAGDIFLLTGRPERAMQTFFDVVEKWPNSGKIWMIMGELELFFDAYKSPLLAISYLKKAIEVGYETAETYTLLGRAYLKIKYTDDAEKAAKTALKINETWEPAFALLDSVNAHRSLPKPPLY